jgi:hypothetical protein
MTRNDAGKLSVLARGLNLGVKYKSISISDDVKKMLTEQKGKLSYSVYIAKLLGVKYEG